MKPVALLAALLAGLVGGVLGVKLFAPAGAGALKKETAYERVMRTGVLRCGWAISPPVVAKDPASGELSGLYVELMNAAAAMAGLKMEWSAEVDWGQVGAALDGGKADVFCGGMWPDAKRARGMAFLPPFFYNAVGMIVREDDARFPATGATPATLPNAPEFTACALEGDVTQAVVVSDLPKAKMHLLPQMANFGDGIAAIRSKKCDFMVAPAIVGHDMKAQKIPVRFTPLDPPLRQYGVVPVVARQEWELKQYLEAVLTEFISTPTYDRIMKDYQTRYPGAMNRPAQPYKE